MVNYRSVYDEDEDDLGIGGQEYLVGENPTGEEFADMSKREIRRYTRGREKAAEAGRNQTKAMAEEEFKTGTKVGGMGKKGAVGMSLMAIAGDAMNANDDTFQANYASVGATSNSGIFKAINKGKKSGGVVALASHAVESFARRGEKQSMDARRGNKMDVARDMTVNILTAGLMSDPTQLKRKKAEQTDRLARQGVNAAPITGEERKGGGAATGGMMGYATGGESGYDVKKIEGPKGIDNTPIDGDMNNAGVTGRTIKGYAQDGETTIKLRGKNYVFSKETGFTKEADALVKKYKYNKEEDDFEGDDLAEAGFASDISKLRDEQEVFNSSIVVDSYGMPEVDTQGEYIIRDPNILNKIAKRRKTSPKKLAHKLGETTIAQKVKEASHELDAVATGGYAIGGADEPDELQAAIDESSVGLVKGDPGNTGMSREQIADMAEQMIFEAENYAGTTDEDRYNITYGRRTPITYGEGDNAKYVSEMTLKEVRKLQEDEAAKNKTINDFATGAYQITGGTLDDFLKNNPGYDTETQLYDEDFQKDVFNWLLDKGGIDDVVSGKRTFDDFYMGQYSEEGKLEKSGLVQRWAGLPNLYDTDRGKADESFYQSDLNKATIDSTRVREIQQSHNAYDPTIYGFDPESENQAQNDYYTLPEAEITEKSIYKKPAARDIDVNVAPELTPGMMDPSDPLPTDDIASADSPFKGPFKKFREKRWMKRHEDDFKVSDNDVFQNEYMASVNDSVKGVATGGYFPGYAIGDEQEEEEGRGGFGQTARVLGMVTPAAYNIAYGLTQKPKKLGGNYMTSTITDPEPIDVTPELRDIEKAGASTRAGGRARSSMAGQIASQTAEQEAISKVYRTKTAMDQEADLQVEKMNATIRQQNARMKYTQDLQGIQAEEALQQYINTGMSQIGQIAQTLGTESLQRKQLDTMADYYETIGEQGQAMLDLQRERLEQEGLFTQQLLDQGAAVKTPEGGDDADKVVLDEDGNPIVTPAGGQGDSDSAITLDEGDRYLYQIDEPMTPEDYRQATITNKLEFVNKARRSKAIKGDDPGGGYKYAETLDDITDEELELLANEPLDQLFIGSAPARQLGFDAPGTMKLSDKPELHKGVPTANSMITYFTDDEGRERPHILNPEYEQEFTDWAYLQQQGTGWDHFKESTILTDWLTPDPEVKEDYDPLDYYDDPEEYKRDMLEFVASKGHAMRVETKNGPEYHEYYTPFQRLGPPGPTGKFGGKVRPETSSVTKFVEGAASFASPGPKAVTRIGALTKMIGKGKFIANIGGKYQIIKAGSKVPVGMKAVISPSGKVVFTKSNQMLTKGWRQIAKAGETIGAKASRAQGIKSYTKGNILPRDLYFTGTGDVILQATGKSLGWTAKQVVKLANKKVVKQALGKGREGMQKLWKNTNYIFKNGQWWRLTHKAQTTGRGASKVASKGAARFPNLQNIPGQIKKDVGTITKSAAKTAGVKPPVINIPKIDISKLGKPVQTALNKLKGSSKAQRIAELKKNAKLTKAELKKAIDAVMRGWSKIKPGKGGGGTSASSSSTATAGADYVYTTP